MKVSIVSATDAPVTTISLAMGTSYNKNDSSFKRVKTAAKHNHGSVFEFANFVMRIDGISRACANQLVRHRHGSYCQQSQRYVKYKELGLTDFVYPDSIGGNSDAQNAFIEAIKTASESYEKLLELGIKAEDARYVLPNAMTTSITVGMNAREFFNFLNLRLSKNAQWEIRELAETMYNTLRAQNEEWDYLLSLYDEYMKNIIN